MNLKHLKFLVGIVFTIVITSHASAVPGQQSEDAQSLTRHPIKTPRRPYKTPHVNDDTVKSQVLERDEDGVAGYPLETLLSVQYEGGLIKELKVSQAGGDGFGGGYPHSWRPSVSEKRRLCTDLCEAGLGGSPCGLSCHDSMAEILQDLPINMVSSSSGKLTDKKQDKKNTHNVVDSHDKFNTTEVQQIGIPRFEVCPKLCDNDMGQPLCSCPLKSSDSAPISWISVCSAFCHSSSPYRPEGCPPCQDTEDMTPNKQNLMLASYNSDAWVQWCTYQCKRGDGGAACNCDQAPLF